MSTKLHCDVITCDATKNNSDRPRSIADAGWLYIERGRTSLDFCSWECVAKYIAAREAEKAEALAWGVGIAKP